MHANPASPRPFLLIPKPNFVLHSQPVILIVGLRLLTHTDPVFVILISSLFGRTGPQTATSRFPAIYPTISVGGEEKNCRVRVRVPYRARLLTYLTVLYPGQVLTADLTRAIVTPIRLLFLPVYDRRPPPSWWPLWNFHGGMSFVGTLLRVRRCITFYKAAKERGGCRNNFWAGNIENWRSTTRSRYLTDGYPTMRTPTISRGMRQSKKCVVFKFHQFHQLLPPSSRLIISRMFRSKLGLFGIWTHSFRLWALRLTYEENKSCFWVTVDGIRVGAGSRGSIDNNGSTVGMDKSVFNVHRLEQ